MAEIIESQDNEDSNFNTLDQDPVDNSGQIEEPKVQQQEDDLPEKYRGKSAAEIARMHIEAEKLIGRQAQEVGESRKLLDEFIKQQLNTKKDTQPEAKTTSIEDWYEDPAKAVKQTIESDPVIQSLKEQQALLAQEAARQKIEKTHPDYLDIAQSEDFAEWVKGSKIRLELFAKAHNFDFDAANELLSTYKELKSYKAQKVQATDNTLKAVDQEKRQQTLKAAAVQKGGTGESSKPIYRRVDLIRLKMQDPVRYEMMSEEIMEAYAEGRVK